MDSHVRPESLMAAWTQAAVDHGVTLVENCPLTAFDTRSGTVAGVRTPHGRYTADRFVLAAGVWSADILRRTGIRIPVVPGKGYSITMERPAACPRIPCYLYERNVVVTPWASGYRLGGTMEFSGFDDRLDARRLANLEQSAARYMQMPVGRRVVERWTGLRPMCVDDLPIIDRVPGTDNLLVATGHGMLGLTTATGTGRLIADMALEQSPGIDPRPFSIRRFGG
jgi:D-amino-acid dehydrogenase